MSLMLALAAAGAASAAAGAASAADEAALREAKLVTWPKLYRENDWRGLDAFLADEFVAMNADGTMERKAEAVAFVRNTPWTGAANNFSYRITGISFYAPDVANVFGVGSMDGAGCRLSYSSANIFVRRAGRWRPSFSHTTTPACITEQG